MVSVCLKYNLIFVFLKTYILKINIIIRDHKYYETFSFYNGLHIYFLSINFRDRVSKLNSLSFRTLLENF